MKYEGRTFTLPASNNASEIEWDYTFLSDKAFDKKWSVTKKEWADVMVLAPKIYKV